MENTIKKIVKIYNSVTVLYAMGLAVWAGTIYLYMHHIGYSYGKINLYLSIFWIITFFLEIPSGIFADRFGIKRTMIINCVFRSLGLLILTFGIKSDVILILSGIFTGLGDSLNSGTMSSWVVKKVYAIDEDYNITKLFARNSLKMSLFSISTGFIGAQVLGNIDLALPIIFGSIFLIMVVPIILMIPAEEDVKKSNFQEFIEEIKNNGLPKFEIKNLKLTKELFYFLIANLAGVIIVTGPFNQWQLFFQKTDTNIQTGYIMVLMDLVGLLGMYLLNKYFSSKNNVLYKILSIRVINGIFIVAAACIGNYVLAVSFFLLHVLVLGMEEVMAGGYFHSLIKSDDRTTIVSIQNSLEAGLTVVALWINGVLSDHYGIGNAWIIATIIGLIISFMGFALLMTKIKQDTIGEKKL